MGTARPPLSRDWTTLGGLLALLAVDEVAALHEHTAGPLIDAVGTVTGSGAFVTRVVAAALVVAAGAVAALVLVRVFAPLPAPTRVGLLVAACVFFGAALGLELAGRLITVASEDDGALYAAAGESGIEECLEIVGSSLAVFTLARTSPIDSYAADAALWHSAGKH